MNYLAHAFLSFNHPDILLGNMISDFVKGKRQFTYPPSIQKGIRLHRAIDSFTDDHLIIREAKSFFRADYGLYSAAIVDVVFDHFLAADESVFAGDQLASFTQDVYNTLEQFQAHFPERFSRMFPHMKTQDWLMNYRHSWGTARSLEGLVHRAQYLTESETAFRLFQQHYVSLQQYYREFFPELQSHAKEKLAVLLSNDD